MEFLRDLYSSETRYALTKLQKMSIKARDANNLQCDYGRACSPHLIFSFVLGPRTKKP